jgi:hypothetical protein
MPYLRWVGRVAPKRPTPHHALLQQRLLVLPPLDKVPDKYMRHYMTAFNCHWLAFTRNQPPELDGQPQPLHLQ